MNDKAIEKFWNNIEKTKWCWNWTGPLDKSGLPVIRLTGGIVDGKQKLLEFSPRRLSIELDNKTINISERVQPLVCKNKICVNPTHLVFGDEARFWAKVQKLNNDCWIWTASQDKDMYGKFKIVKDGKKIDIRAHQYSWQLHTGRPLVKGMVICHKCDHPYCVNPDHLFLGEVIDNNRDAVSKGRNPHGETHGKSKLNEEQVKEIRELHNSGHTTTQLSKNFGVARSVIYSLVNNLTWKHIK